MRSGESLTTQFHRRLVCEYESERGIKLKSSARGLKPGRDRKNSYKQNSANQPEGDSLSRCNLVHRSCLGQLGDTPTPLFRLCPKHVLRQAFKCESFVAGEV